MAFNLQSPSFSQNDFIPTKFTCQGEDISPALTWEEPPANTKSFVLIVDDPDATHGTWDHWLIYNIPADATNLPENLTKAPLGSEFGKNSWGRNDYGGPCPPSGVHRYIFTLYALDTQLKLTPAQADKTHLQHAMQGHVLAQTKLIGRYGKTS